MRKIPLSFCLPLIFSSIFISPVSADISIGQDTTFSGTLQITQDIILTDSSTLTIAEGTVLLMDANVSIKGSARCHILINGTAQNQVVIKSATPNTYWGQLIVHGDSASIEIQYADIMSGQIYAMDSTVLKIENSFLHDYLRLPTKNLVYTHNAYSFYMNQCHVSNYYQLNPFNTPVLIENSLFEYINEDGIDCDNSPSAMIRNCTFRNGLCEKGKVHSVDAIDFGKYNMEGLGSIGEVQNCFFYNITDKGVSAGEGSRLVKVHDCIFYRCGSGATIKDSSIAEFYHNTVVSCEYGVECVEKNVGLGGGHTTGHSNILWNNQHSSFLDSDGTLFLDYSDISFSGIFPGTGNINAYPQFVDTLSFDFHLLGGSPCIGSGLSGTDMGAIYPVGGIATPTDYLNIGIPYSGEVISGDSVYTINWLSGDSIHFVNLEFSSDNGQSWTSIAQNLVAKSGSYTWTIPNVYSSKCFIRVTDVSNVSLTSTQNLPFSILPTGTPTSPPAFSYPAGFYTNSLSLQLTGEPNATIYYTLDGSDPTDQSLQYTVPISLDQQYILSGYTEQNITATNPPHLPLCAIRSAPVSQIGPNPAIWYMPTGDISKIQVVKARSYIAGYGLSSVVTNSYLIDQDSTLNPAGLSVISLTTDKDNFFDYYSGIYIPGYSFTGYSFTGNYEAPGSLVERPVHFEYFEPLEQRILSLDIGVRPRGEWIRSLGQKALSLYARSEYDSTNYFNHEFFPGYKKTGTANSMNSFKRLILRNDGNNWGWMQTTMMKDATAQSLFDHMNLKYQAYRPSIVFLDGEYWGLHDIRELPDERNLALTYNMEPEEITMIEDNLDGKNQLIIGPESDLTDFLALRDFTSTQDLTQQSAYDYVAARIDVENFVDFWISNFFMRRANIDHNIGFWKQSGSTLNPSAPPGKDGRWRWQAYDYDFSFTEPTSDVMPLMHWMDSLNNYLFFKLLTNDSFRIFFVNRYSDLINSSFKSSRVQERILANKAEIEPEIERHIRRWGTPHDFGQWQQGIDSLLYFAQLRPAAAFNEVKNFLSLSAPTQLTMNVNDTSQGKVRVNTITINAELHGVTASIYPWQGNYFRNFPVTLIPIPEPGYRFSHWLETSLTTDTLTVYLLNDSIFTAVFEIDSNWTPFVYPQIWINEVAASNLTIPDNYGETDDWLELYNPNDSAVDLANWFISDKMDEPVKHRFLDNDSVIIPAHGFLLLFADNEIDQGVTHVSFKLEAVGENILLTAPDGITLIDSVSFGLQVTDTSFGRYPDGSPSWEFFTYTTPGSSNIHIDVQELAPGKPLSVYPNPLSGNTLYFNQEISFRLFNEMGSELVRQENKTSLDASALYQGIYFLRTDAGQTIRIVIVE